MKIETLKTNLKNQNHVQVTLPEQENFRTENYIHSRTETLKDAIRREITESKSKQMKI